MKARVIALVVVVIGLLAGGAFLTWFFGFRIVKLDFDELGGTVLVYEIDLRENPRDDHIMFDPDRDINVLTEAIERRVDPDGRGYAYVRALGKNRVEIRIPRKEGHADDILAIKDLISRAGVLEFRMLANGADDKLAIDDMRRFIEDPATTIKLKEARERGLPPPSLREGKEPKAYKIVTSGGAASIVTYRWVELGPQERRVLDLDNAAREDAARNKAWIAAAGARDRAIQLPESGPGDRLLLSGALFFSRKCEDRNLPEDARRRKQFEYFVLARDPEFDAADPNRRTPRVDGSYLSNAYTMKGQDGRPTVSFTFNAAGGELFANLTRKNITEGRDGPPGTMKLRHLAIILDGLVMSAPTINSEIRRQGQISGNFTQKEVDALVAILRSGALPARLNLTPVSESEVPPREKK